MGKDEQPKPVKVYTQEELAILNKQIQELLEKRVTHTIPVADLPPAKDEEVKTRRARRRTSIKTSSTD